MRFTLIDRITELDPGQAITAIKNLTMAEEHLQDHFPLFPVMPGVLMLEALYQASAWLIRGTDDFAHSMIELSEVRNTTFKDFVEPGQALVVTSKIQKRVDDQTWVQAEGKVDGRSAVRARLILDCYNLSDRNLASDAIDRHIISEFRRDYENLLGLGQPAS